MAYQARGRDPLLDSNMAAAIEKRGKELIGLALLAFGLAVAAMAWSYSPEDPSFLAATDAPVQNWLGGFGAQVAAPLFMVVGMGTWALAVMALVWGGRFVLHYGEERALGRAMLAPIWIVLISLYASSISPSEHWAAHHSFGLGGLFGDTVLGTLLGILPIGATLGLKLLSLALGLATLAFGAFVLGFTRVEIRYAGRFLLLGLIVTYDRVMRLVGHGASGALYAAQALQEKQRAARAARAQEAEAAAAWAASDPAYQAPAAAQGAQGATAPVAMAGSRREPQLQARPVQVHRGAGATVQEPQVIEREEMQWHPAQPMSAQPMSAEPQQAAMGQPQAKPSGLKALMPSIFKAEAAQAVMPQSELVEQPAADIDPDMPTEDRLKAKISSAIKARAGGFAATRGVSHNAHVLAERPLTKGRGRGPDALLLNKTQGAPAGLPPEPPLTAATPAPQARMDARVEPVLTQPGTAPIPQAPAGFEPDMVPMDAFDEMDVVETENVFAEEMRAPQATAHTAAHMAGQRPQAAPQPIPAAQPKKVVQHTIRKAVQPSTRARAEAQPALQFEDSVSDYYELPPLSLLASAEGIERHHLSDEALEENARMLETVLDDYGVKGEIVSVRPGPVVTMYELEPAPGLKASRVIGLADDIARSMSALSARVSTVPGRSVIGIELPNEHREMVSFREILSSRDYGDGNQKLPLALGKDIGGDPVVANLAKMPHLLIAGTTGSGKSVAINTMILSLLYKLTPEDCRLIMIDPKMLELSVYDGIPHLLSPVVTDPKKAVVALKWTVGEMEERYRKMSKMGVRNIDGYNSRVEDALAKGEMFSRTVQTGFDDDTGDPIFETEEFAPEKMPYIVVVVDEMADLMMVAGKEIEACIQRLAQMARASGIHIIMATQRPSVDVITGTIKANFPTRISFQVTSKVDSRTILGEMGAEQLLGMGDMLYMAGGAKITRCHGPFVSDEEVEEVVTYLKQFGPPSYVGSVLDGPDDEKAEDIDAVLGLNTGGNTGGEDALYDQAVQIAITDRKCSTSYIQRKLAIGYNKAARLVEQMEENGVVSPANHVGKREILVPEQH